MPRGCCHAAAFVAYSPPFPAGAVSDGAEISIPMSLPLEGKTALVTGGARGIGRAICETLAARGADIAVADLQAEWCADTVAAVEALGRRAVAIAANVADAASAEAAVAKAIETLGRIDILVNNAGITKDTLLLRMSEADWDAVLNVNLKGAYLMTKAAIQPMVRQRSGAIVNIASIVGQIGQAGQCNYAASKGGLIAFTKSVAKEYAARGIRANAVAPGFIQSAMTDKLPEAVRAQMLAVVPLKRMGTGEDIAKVVAFLVGDDSAYLTGQVLAVNGGMMM